jgi:hypothetical protein
VCPLRSLWRLSALRRCRQLGRVCGWQYRLLALAVRRQVQLGGLADSRGGPSGSLSDGPFPSTDATALSSALLETTSIAAAVISTSRRGITEQWELSLPPQRSECFCDDHPKHLLGIDSPLQAESTRRGEPVSCGVEEPPRCWNPRHAHIPAGKQTGQRTDPTRAEFVGANRLFARLVLHQVRPHNRPAAAAKQRNGFSHNRNPDLVSVPASDAGLSFTLRSERPVTTAPAAAPDLLPAPIEALFSELARRRLRRLTAKERP